MGGPLDGAGMIPDPSTAEFLCLSAVMHGARGLNLFLSAEEDFWSGSPLRQNCSTRDDYFKLWQGLLRFLRESRMHERLKSSRVLLMYNRGLDSLAAVLERRHDFHGLDLGGEVFNETVDLGFHVSPEACTLWLDQTVELIRDVGHDWDCGDSAMPEERLSKYGIALFPVGDFIFSSDLARLKKFVDQGGILVFGPGKPYLDERMQENPETAGFFSGAIAPDDYLSLAARGGRPYRSLVHMESPHEVGKLINALGVSPKFTRNNTALDIVLHGIEDGNPLLFIANGTGKAQRSDIFFQGRISIRRWGETELRTSEGKISVELEPHSIQVWEVMDDIA